jgi:5-methylthioadenosine/S-adenosylhomocysteine deaminase
MATLLTASAVLPMEDANRRRLLQPGAVLVDRGVIAGVGPPETFEGVEAERVDLAGQALIPGLHNCHMHSGLLRGTAEDLPLLDWLRTYVDPMHRALTPEIAEAASRLCYAESLLAGTTSVMDMWRFLDRAAVVAGDLGLRATLVPYLCEPRARLFRESRLEPGPAGAGRRRRARPGVGRARAPALLHAAGL